MELEPRQADLVLLVSDTHIGRKTESYNVDVFNKRMQTYIEAVRRHKRMLQRGRVSLRNINLVFLGDIVDGEAIYRRQRYEQEMNIDEQIDVAVNVFEELVYRVGVTNIYAVPGNHGRSRVDGTGNWDYMLYRLLEEKLNGSVSVTVFSDGAGYAGFGGATAYMFHGDQIRMYQQIPFYGIVKYVGRQYMIKPFDIVFLGHFHVLAKYVYNGVSIYFNGAMLTDDELSKRYALRNKPMWWLVAVSSNSKDIIYEATIDLDGGGF